jgi:hypothetical protein
MGTVPEDPPPGRWEHKSVTIGDLAALVVGIAMVLVLPATQSYWPLPSDFLGPWPRWLPWLFCLRQALGAACVALVPVVLWRRACYGGLARHAEFLALCAAMPFLAASIETALIRLSFRLKSGQSPPGFGLDGMPVSLVKEWEANSHWVWEQAVLLTGVVALALFFLGRRNSPGWLLSALLILAWLGAYDAGPQLVGRWFFPVIARVNGRPVGETAGVLLSSLIYLLPRSVLYSVPAIAAVYVIRRGGWERLGWLDWTSLGLAAALFLITEPTEMIRYYSVTRGTGTWATETSMRAVTLLAALVLGTFLNHIGRALWSRIADPARTRAATGPCCAKGES